MQLRPYQEAARVAVQQEWDEGRTKTLLVLPTGCGKTIVFTKITEDRVKLGERVLILAHRSELLEQASDKIKMAIGLETSLEKAEHTALGSWNRIVVGSVQTLQNEKRLSKFPKDYFDTIIIDEAHHSVTDGYQRIVNYFESAKVLGVTATPDRGDKQNLGKYYDSVAYEYSIVEAIREGYLSKISATTIPLTLDLSSVGTQAGDFKAGDVGNVLDPYLEQIADEMVKQCANRKTVVFLPLVKTSQKFRDILNAKGFKAAEVNGESKDRAEILEDFDNDKYNVLCNSMLLTEGWDCPSVDCVVVLRPTKVRALYSQMVGRGTRIFPGKTDVLLLDFLWHTARHELCRPANIISESPEVVKKITEIMAEEDNQEHLFDLEDIEVVAAQDVVAEREAALAEKLAEMRKRKRRQVDPLQFEMSIQAEDLVDYVPTFDWEKAPPSKKQLEKLEKFGIFSDDIGNAGKASRLLDRLNKRRMQGLTTPKQIRLLERYGFRHVGMWEFDVAKNMIDRIASAGWRLPAGVNPREYQPS